MEVSNATTARLTFKTDGNSTSDWCKQTRSFLPLLLLLFLSVGFPVAHATTDNMVWSASSSFSSKYHLSKAAPTTTGRIMGWIWPSTSQVTRSNYQKQFVPTSRHHVTSTLTSESNENIAPRVAIVGGGLAGLSTAYHLLQKTAAGGMAATTNLTASVFNVSSSIDITILDPASVGTAGASSVAGGLIHPLSPRGKLVPLGLEGLASTNELLNHAMRFEPQSILRDEILRIAITEEHVRTLKETARQFPDWSEWIDREDLPPSLLRLESKEEDRGASSLSDTTSPESDGPRGALRLFSGCQVIHVPSYLKGLWSACCALVADKSCNNKTTARWLVEPELTRPGYDWKQRLSEFDVVVFSAGSGLFQDPSLSSTESTSSDTNSLLNLKDFPATLVRGQSMELKLKRNEKNRDQEVLHHAMLCGKYVSPLPAKDKVLIGATHEYQSEPWSKTRVEDELKERSYGFASHVWDSIAGSNSGDDGVITSGIRVQSNRGKFGRMPMIGRYETTDLHHNAWLFTGLSSRGLLYHGVLGDVLTDQMLQRDGTSYKSDVIEHLDWWKK